MRLGSTVEQLIAKLKLHFFLFKIYNNITMSAIIRFLAKQFASKKVTNKQYIDIKPLIENYKSIRGNSKAVS